MRLLIITSLLLDILKEWIRESCGSDQSHLRFEIVLPTVVKNNYLDHEVDQKDGHNRDECGRNEGLCQERKRSHIGVHLVKDLVGVCNLDQPSDEGFMDATFIMFMIVIMMVVPVFMSVNCLLVAI